MKRRANKHPIVEVLPRVAKVVTVSFEARGSVIAVYHRLGIVVSLRVRLEVGKIGNRRQRLQGKK